MTDVLQPPSAPASAADIRDTATDWPAGLPRRMSLEEYLAWGYDGVRADWLWREPLPSPEDALSELPA